MEGEAAAAASAAGIALRLDRDAVLGFLRDREFDMRRTCFAEVALLEPLTTAVRGPGGRIALSPPPPGPAPAPDAGPASSARRIRAALDAAVEGALASAERPAVALTGGLDSSAVAAAAAAAWRRLGRPAERLRFVHLLPPFGPSEVEHARAVAGHVGHALVEVTPPDGDPLDGTEALLAANDFPADGGGPAAWAVLGARLRDDGVDRMLTGDAGDEAVGPSAATRGALRGFASRLRVAAGKAFSAPRGAPENPAWLESRAGGAPRTAAAPPPRAGLRGAAAERDASLRSGRQTANLGWLAAFDRVFGTRSVVPFLDPLVQDAVLSVPPAHFAAEPSPKGLLRLAYAEALPAAQRDRPKDQPYWEPLFRRDFERFGGAWVERFVRGGTLERLDAAPTREVEDLFRRAGRGGDADLSLALTVVGVAAWCRARSL